MKNKEDIEKKIMSWWIARYYKHFMEPIKKYNPENLDKLGEK